MRSLGNADKSQRVGGLNSGEPLAYDAPPKALPNRCCLQTPPVSFEKLSENAQYRSQRMWQTAYSQIAARRNKSQQTDERADEDIVAREVPGSA